MNILLREATTNDARILFDWTNDSVTRKNSFDHNPIDWNNHIMWLNKKLNDSNSKFYMFHLDNEPVGLVRFEMVEKTIIGVTIAPNKRGMGFGSKIIELACLKYRENSKRKILAYIKNDNVASQKVFEKAGFTFYKKGFYNDVPCIILTLY